MQAESQGQKGGPLSSDLDDPTAIPYFLWDERMTAAELQARRPARPCPRASGASVSWAGLWLDLPGPLPRMERPLPRDKRKHDALQLHYQPDLRRQRQVCVPLMERRLAPPEAFHEDLGGLSNVALRVRGHDGSGSH
jgi:hypothetical protein